MMRIALTDHDAASLADEFRTWDAKPSQAIRVLRAFYDGAGRVDLPPLRIGRKLQERLISDLPLRQSSVAARSASSDGTVKLLLTLTRGGAVESVLMPSYDPTRAA